KSTRMNFSRLFYSLISLAVALFFLLLGIISLMLPWSPSARSELILFILEHSQTIALLGLGWILIGLSIVVYTLLSARHHYLYLRSGPRSIKIDESIIHSYLETYWKKLFPHAEIPHRVTLKRNKIHVTADLPYVPANEQKAFLAKVN